MFQQSQNKTRYAHSKEKLLHLVNVHRVISMPNETIYHVRQDGVQSVHSLYEVTDRDRKLKPGWKVLVRSLCIIAMLLECANVVVFVFAEREH